MGWIISMFIATVVSVVIFLVGWNFRAEGKQRAKTPPRGEYGSQDAENERTGGTLAMVAAVVIFVIWVGLHTLIASVHQVPAGNSGVVYQFSGIVGQTSEGLQIRPPWQTLKNASIQIQALAFITDDSKVPEGVVKVGGGLNSFSKETQNVYVDTIVRIKVSPENIQNLYRIVGSNYVSKLIPGLIAQIFKDETVKYSSVDLAPNREIIRHNVEEKLRTELSRFSIDVDALLVENLSFDPSFEAAITDKMNAAQEALKQQALVAASTAKAQQVAAEAQGSADKLRIEAGGQADANRLITESISPLLVQWQAVQKLAPNVQIALLPSGQGIIIDPAQLLKSAASPAP